MKKKDIAIISVGLVLLVFLVVLSFIIPSNPVQNQGNDEGVTVLTDKTEYSPGDELKVFIENNKEDKICFSSCYPYYIQKQDDSWITYNYENCSKEDLVEKCVDPKTRKAFELTLPSISEGPHRIMVSACLGCSVQEKFVGEEAFISNNFIVK